MKLPYIVDKLSTTFSKLPIAVTRLHTTVLKSCISLLWSFPIDGMKFAKLHLVDVKLPTAVPKLPTAVTNLDFFIAHESCFVVF